MGAVEPQNERGLDAVDDHDAVTSLVAYDETLRRGGAARHSAPLPGGRADRAAVCLRLLESVYPRNGAQRSLPAQIGRFRIDGFLGEGGFGIVYRAWDPVIERPVALKIPHLRILDRPELQRRFLDDARLAGKLDHPHVVPVHEVGTVGGQPYISSMYCDGGTLHDWLARQTGPVPARTAAELVRQLAEGVEHAHSRGVLHRDLKPTNVLLVQTESGGEILLKIADFGLGKLLEADGAASQSSAAIGTLNYMAPEQLLKTKQRPIGFYSDVYALGVILYELLTREPPFAADTAAELTRLLAGTNPPSLRRLRPDVPVDLETICHKCLTIDPRQRYATAAALAEDLQRFLDGLRPRARPPSRVDTMRRWVRRNPVIAALGALCVLAVIAILAIQASHAKPPALVALENEWKEELGMLPREERFPGMQEDGYVKFDAQRGGLTIEGRALRIATIRDALPDTFDFTITLEQLIWRGGDAGILLGYHPFDWDGNPAVCFQAFWIRHDPENYREGFTVRRAVAKAEPLSGQLYEEWHDSSEELPMPPQGQGELRIVVAAGKVQSVEWCGVPYPELTGGDVAGRVPPEYALGSLGLFVSRGTMLFRNPKFYDSSFKRKGSHDANDQHAKPQGLD